jgi:hypothetical protein
MRSRWLVLVLALGASAGRIQAAETPRQIVDSMIAAHGGMERWTSAPTVSFSQSGSERGKPIYREQWGYFVSEGAWSSGL